MIFDILIIRQIVNISTNHNNIIFYLLDKNIIFYIKFYINKNFEKISIS